MRKAYIKLIEISQNFPYKRVWKHIRYFIEIKWRYSYHLHM